MKNEIAVKDSGFEILNMPRDKAIQVLKASIYPGAKDESVGMVLDYCTAAKLDPLKQVVHIVPMYDKALGKTRDVIMQGVNFHLTAAERNGCSGISEPEYGEEVTEQVFDAKLTYPKWCKVRVRRVLANGKEAEFVGYERFMECVSTSGYAGKERVNAIWKKRPFGMLAKCALSQALRKAFPSIAGGYTAEEMVGKTIGDNDFQLIDEVRDEVIEVPPEQLFKKKAKQEAPVAEVIDVMPVEKAPEPDEKAPEPKPVAKPKAEAAPKPKPQPEATIELPEEDIPDEFPEAEEEGRKFDPPDPNAVGTESSAYSSLMKIINRLGLSERELLDRFGYENRRCIAEMNVEDSRVLYRKAIA